MAIRGFVVASVLFFASARSLSAQVPSGSTIDWAHSANAAAFRAQQTKRPLLVYVSSDNCGFCHKLQQDVWSDPEIIAMVNDGFVPLELHAQQDAELVAALQVHAFPMTLIISTDGRPVDRIKDYKPPNEFKAVLRDSPHGQVRPQCVVSDENQPPRRIRWQRSVKAVGGLALRSKLPILVYVSSNDCGHCRRMEREVWSNTAIVAMVEGGFIPLELKAERDADLVESLKVQGFPTTLLVSWDGQYIDSKAGYIPPNQMAELLRGGQQSLLVSQQVTQSP